MLLSNAADGRLLDDVATHIYQALRQPQLRQLPLIEAAFGQQVLALLTILNAACGNVERLGQASAEAFRTHPDHAIIDSFPGVGDTTGARLLGEIGDDRDRFRDPRTLKAYAGSAPITRASGRSLSITRRRIKNDQLAAIGFVWAFMAITNSPSARAHYDHRRQAGDHSVDRCTPTRTATSTTSAPANTARTASRRCSTTDKTTRANPGLLNPDAPRRRRAQAGRNRPLSQISWRTSVARQSTEDTSPMAVP